MAKSRMKIKHFQIDGMHTLVTKLTQFNNIDLTECEVYAVECHFEGNSLNDNTACLSEEEAKLGGKVEDICRKGYYPTIYVWLENPDEDEAKHPIRAWVGEHFPWEVTEIIQQQKEVTK